MQTASPILAPIVALVTWSMFIWAWMYATRLPAIRKAKLQLDPAAPRGEQMNTLPASVRWKADNYNHLMEQPTLFYAITFALALMGQGDGVNLVLAWAYVGLRIVHSLFQALINKIEIRFVFFMLSSLMLVGLTISAIAQLL
ncbi:MAPEG family protein [Microbulbifer hainanensis]|uniref:MAPEG family protein n=1 Tax=Microbulbifer hainanensis TaxID=2735675 RepID=UPI0018677516|nr:MAPEG family protein [Microbulbifer hainanensis]